MSDWIHKNQDKWIEAEQNKYSKVSFGTKKEEERIENHVAKSTRRRCEDRKGKALESMPVQTSIVTVEVAKVSTMVLIPGENFRLFLRPGNWSKAVLLT